MLVLRIVLLFLVLGTRPFGSICQAGAGCSRELPVQSQSDLDSISNCQTFTGTITIANLGIPTITLAGVQVINGNLLLANNLNTARVSFPNLQGVTGQLSITNHTVMSTLDMPALTDVDSFSVLVAPALDALVFPQGLNQVNSLHIADTYITKAAGLSFTRATSVIVSNNLYLKLVDLPRLELTKGIYVTANGQNSVDVKAPNLTTINNGTFDNVGALNLPSLSTVEGDLSFNQNAFQSLTFSNLTRIGGTLTIIANNQLANLSMPSLSFLGGALSIVNNTNLRSIIGFPQLQEVDGTVDVTGAFDSFQLPNINDVRGSMNVQTTSNQFKCSSIDGWQNGVVKGNGYVCKAAVANPKTGMDQPGAVGSQHSGGTSSRVSATSGIGRSASWAVAGIVTVSVGFSAFI